MEKRYFETKDIYLAAYLTHICYTFLDAYKLENGITIFVFEYKGHIDCDAMKFMTSDNDICFDDFQDEICSTRLISERDD